MGLFGWWNLTATQEAVFVEVDPVLSEIVRDEDGDIDGLAPVDAGHVFDLGAEDFPVMDTFFGHFPHRMEVHAVDGDGNRMLVLEDDYLRRSPLGRRDLRVRLGRDGPGQRARDVG
jgi:hypothetical protein